MAEVIQADTSSIGTLKVDIPGMDVEGTGNLDPRASLAVERAVNCLGKLDVDTVNVSVAGDGKSVTISWSPPVHFIGEIAPKSSITTHVSGQNYSVNLAVTATANQILKSTCGVREENLA